VICTANECGWLASRQGDGMPWDRLFFCAKESAISACSRPRTGSSNSETSQCGSTRIMARST